jgi:hypothetical protein
MNYNYLFINSKHFKVDRDSYYSICIRDLEKYNNIQIMYSPLEHKNIVARFLCAVHNSKRVNQFIKLPLKHLWYPNYFKTSFDNNKPLCIICQYLDFPADYFYYLRNLYPNARIVKIHRDLIELTRKRCLGLTYNVEKDVFDLSLSFDETEAKTYKYPWFSEFESKLYDLFPSEKFGKYDVFFAGVAKDRFPKLLAAYEKFTAAGLKVHYFLIGVPEDLRIPKEGIEYGDNYITYREMLQRTIDAKCLLDVNQSNCVGYTSRFLEAVMYNKILITDNFSVQKHPLYNPNYIQCFTSVEEIDPDILKQDLNSVDYHYTDEFSPIHMIETIDSELAKRF